MKQKQLLLATNSFASYAGSEIVSFEIIEFHLANDWCVDLVTNKFSDPMASHVLEYVKSGKLNVFYPWNPPEKDLNEYSLIWINHSILPHKMLKELGESELNCNLIWHHMGVIPNIEQPLIPDVEKELATKISFVSDEIRTNLDKTFLGTNKYYKFDNPVPLSFINFPDRNFRSSLGKILVVSNHVPDELRDALQILKSNEISFDVVGSNDSPVLITPELLCDYDAVISIGKTTQYSLVLGLPVYSYDHFGGAGWISASNIEEEASFNFSGRSSRRKISSSEIAHELINGYSDSLNFTLKFKEQAKLRWNLKTKLFEIQENLNTGERSLTNDSLQNALNFTKFREELEFKIYDLDNHWQNLNSQFDALQASHNLAHEMLDNIKSSISWKITKPIRLIKEKLVNLRHKS